MSILNKEQFREVASATFWGQNAMGTRARFTAAKAALVCAGLAWAAPLTQGVILYGTADPNANTQAPAGALAGSGWEYQGRWGNFLGTAIAPNHFVTAKHVGGNLGQTFTFRGVEYTTVARFPSPDSDLQIWQVTGSFPSYAPLYTGSDEVGKNLVVFGRGTQRGAEVLNNSGELAGWQRGASDGRMRWGENVIGGILYGGSSLGYLLRVSFDRTGGENEAMLSAGDSGGGLFVQEGGVWKLAGISYGVDGPFNTSSTGEGFFGAIFDKGGLYEKGGTGWKLITNVEPDIPGGFGATRVSEHLGWISSITGMPRAEKVYYVDSRATGAGTGASWADACPSLQSALEQAQAGDEIWVAAGTYRPGQSGQQLATFELKSGVAVYGGFAGTETRREARDPLRFQTVLSGDLNGDDGLNWANTTDNSRHVVRATGLGITTVLDGFTISGGNALAPNDRDGVGGGVVLQDSSVWIVNCRIEKNRAQRGGGLFVAGGRVAVDGCTFRANAAETDGGAWFTRGGQQASQSTFRDCLFLGNSAGGSAGAGNGGGGYVDAGSVMELWHCTLTANRSLALSSDARPTGGGLSVNADGIKVVGCLFWSNEAGTGAGGGLWSGGLNGLVLNCVFGGNRAATGGGVANGGGSLDLLGCTLVGNRAEQGGGLRTDLSAQTRVRNSIFWTNQANATEVYVAQVHEANGGVADIAFSCVQGLWTSQPGQPARDPAKFPGCLDADPAFANLAGRDYRLLLTSPCVNTGDNHEPAAGETDLTGKPRIINGTVDMGAYETGSTYASWTQGRFTQEELSDPEKEAFVWGPSADPDRDGRPNLVEYAVGSDPRNGANGETIQTRVAPSGQQYYHHLATHRRLDDFTLNFVVEVSSDGQAWGAAPGEVVLASTSPIVGELDFELADHRDLTPVTPGGPRLVRLRVIQNSNGATFQAVSERFVGAAVVIRGNNGSGVHPTAFSQQAVQPVAASGTTGSVVDTSLIDPAANWTEDQFNGANGLHYIEFDSGLKVDIADTVAATRTLILADSIQGSLRRGEGYRIRRHTTVADLFGAANEAGLKAGASFSSADTIVFYLADIQRTMTLFYANVSGFEGWYRSDYTPASDQVVYPDQGILVQRKAPGDIVLFRSGPAPQGPNPVLIWPGYNLVGSGPAVKNVTLAGLNLVTDTPATGLQSGSSTSSADTVILINPDGSATTCFHVDIPGFEGWYNASYEPADGMVIPAGTAFFVRRKAPRDAFEWNTPID